MEKITYGIHQTSFGDVVIAITDKGLCWLGFMVEGYKGNGLERMKEFFPQAQFVKDENVTADMMEKIIQAWSEDRLKDIPLDLRGTKFQLSVWEALLGIPKGEVESYGDIASKVGSPKAARAVGSAVGSNPVSLIVPCHRVVQGTGKLGNYGWGVDLKREILKQENYAASL